MGTASGAGGAGVKRQEVRIPGNGEPIFLGSEIPTSKESIDE